MWFLFLPFPLQELRSEMGVWGLRVPWYGLDFKVWVFFFPLLPIN